MNTHSNRLFFKKDRIYFHHSDLSMNKNKSIEKTSIISCTFYRNVRHGYVEQIYDFSKQPMDIFNEFLYNYHLNDAFHRMSVGCALY